MVDKLSLCVKCNKEVYRQCDQYFCGHGYKTYVDYHNSLPKLKGAGFIKWDQKT